MAATLLDRVKMTVTGTPGTGAFTLNAAMTGYQSLAAAGAVDGDPVVYVAEEGPEGAPTKWEMIKGIYTAATPSLSRVETVAGTPGQSFTSEARIFATASGEDLRTAREKEYTWLSTGGVVTDEMDPSKGGMQTLTLTASITALTDNFLDGQDMTLHITGTSSFDIDWSGIVNWYGSQPTIPATGLTGIAFHKKNGVLYGKGIGDVA